MKTAVEWLIEQLENHNGVTRAGFEKCIQQSKQMEKEQILNAWKHGKMMGNSQLDFSEEYYNQTFKSE